MSKVKTMTPKEIKRILFERDLSISGLARDLKVSRSMVHQVIHNKAVSHRVRCHIARAVGRPVGEIWKIKKDPTRPGRPLGKGLYVSSPSDRGVKCAQAMTA